MTAAPAPPGLSIRLLAGLFLAALALRPQILAIGPLLPLIRADLGMPAAVAGLLTTIPVLCMGLFAPFGPKLASRVGARTALAVCLALVAAAGVARAAAPNELLVLAATLVIGVAIGLAGAIPAIVVAQRLSHAAVHGTSGYAAGIVAGSALGAAVAVPLAIDGDWRRSLVLISLAMVVPIVAWLWLVRPDANARRLAARAPRLPWRSGTGWLLVALFGVQSILYYGIVSWLPNALVERAWDPTTAGSVVALFNAIGLVTTLGVPFAAGRYGSRRQQLIAAAGGTAIGMAGTAIAPDLAFVWILLLGLGLGAIFPLLLTLPVDVADDPSHAGSVAALMLLGGYVLASMGPVVLGIARDVSGSFSTSLWLLVVTATVFLGLTGLLSPARLHRGVRRAPETPLS
jgi:CP family cyanate transporter-like MFS transporter